ncbi:MAG: hypothetical protein ACPGPE_06565 [Planctomycetota bacterium]
MHRPVLPTLLSVTGLSLAGASSAPSIQTPLSGHAGPMHIDLLDESVFGPGWILITKAGSGNDDGAIRAFNVDTGESRIVVSQIPAVIVDGFPLGAAQAKFDDNGVLHVALSHVHPQLGWKGFLRSDTQSIGRSFNTPPTTMRTPPSSIYRTSRSPSPKSPISSTWSSATTDGSTSSTRALARS